MHKSLLYAACGLVGYIPPVCSRSAAAAVTTSYLTRRPTKKNKTETVAAVNISPRHQCRYLFIKESQSVAVAVQN